MRCSGPPLPTFLTLNLVEGFFSELACSALRHIRVASKQELEDRLMAAVITSTAIPSFIHGPASPTRPRDMIPTSKSLDQSIEVNDHRTHHTDKPDDRAGGTEQQHIPHIMTGDALPARYVGNDGRPLVRRIYQMIA
jgi:hypothetical protein